MKIEHWLIIATIINAIIVAIATFLGPALAVLIQSRMSQPKPTPDISQPKNRIHRIGFWLSRHTTLVSVVAILVNLFLIIRELSNSAPLNRSTVFFIALTMSSIQFQFTCLVINSVVKSLFKITDNLVAMIEKLTTTLESQSTTHRAIVDALGDQGDVLHLLCLAIPKKPPQGMLDKLQNTLKKLIGD